MTNLEKYYKEIKQEYINLRVSCPYLDNYLELAQTRVFQRHNKGCETSPLTVLKWLVEIWTSESVLTEAEKEYIRKEITPYQSDVLFIQKLNLFGYTQLRIMSTNAESNLCNIPDELTFEGMELDRGYFLSELGLY